jgi:hypothetical protein
MIIFDFKNKKKEEIGFEDNNYEQEENKKIKSLIQMLNVKINKVVFKNGISNIGCGGYHSFIYDNSFNFFNFYFKKKKIKKKESLFLFGDNNYDQLGIEGGSLNTITNNVLKKFKIEDKKLKNIKCGYFHNLMLIEDGNILILNFLLI